MNYSFPQAPIGEVKFKTNGKYLIQGSIQREKIGRNNRLIINFKYNAWLKDEIKAMQGHHWHGFDDPHPRKVWSVDDCPRNWFQLAYLTCQNPYAWYDQKIIEAEFRRPEGYKHQRQALNFFKTVRHGILAGEMGCVDGNALVGIGKGYTVSIKALYYIFHNVTQHTVKIDSLCNGVISPNIVKDVLYKGKKRVLNLILKSGKSLRLTPDHEVCVGERYIPADKLQSNDLVLTQEQSGKLLLNEIESIIPDGETEVYDIVCDDPHRNFVANDIIVHNCGKTLPAMECMEQSDFENWLWVGPRSALTAVKLEFMIWKSKIWPEFMTYEGLVKLIENWPEGKTAPRGVIFDEASKIRNPTAQRSKAAYHLANSIRAEYGRDSYIILMSGTPAPKDPGNWYHLAEIACPGFLREGNLAKFKQRLALIKMVEGGYGGGIYPKLVTWWDDENKCGECGKLKDDLDHDPISLLEDWYHSWRPSVNEVQLLYGRLRGLVLVQFKKDCLDLPDKIFKRVECKPNEATLRAAELIVASAPTTIQGLILLRELSDGFQYKQVESGVEECPVCKGTGEDKEPFDVDAPDDLLDRLSIERGHRVIYNDSGVQIGQKEEPLKIGYRPIICMRCSGKKIVPTYSRAVASVPCPKDDAVIDLLDLYEDEGRTVFWAGFTGSVDRLTALCMNQGWKVIRVDGRGWWSDIGNFDSVELARIFLKDTVAYPKVAFVGQPGAGGMGLNLTSSSMACYYSNTHHGEDRDQSMDRIHRPGADHNRGVTIYDLIHLASDLKVLEGLELKHNLQAMTLGLFRETILKSPPLERVS